MSYYQPVNSYGTTPLRQFVPSYQARSDYLPGVVKEGANTYTADVVRIN
jgi:hypothetical protein